MLIEYSFISREKNKCYIALCDSTNTEKEASEYWQSHGVENGSWGKFEFHLNKNNEYICLTACKEICFEALQFLLGNLEGVVGQRCCMPDLLAIVRDFDKRIST